MAFNERGEWIDLDPHQTYLDLIQKSAEQPGMGGPLWTSESRHELHNRATEFVMEQRGLPMTVDNFERVRHEIEKTVIRPTFQSEIENGFYRVGVQIPEPYSPFYKHPGD